MSQRWERLHHVSRPPLLYKYNTTTENYDFYLTDLTYVWSERLIYRDILRRADEEKTSIDPSDDNEQLQVLLQKIRDALQGSKDSRVVINPGPKDDLLELTTITQLPAPLKPLQWTLYLSRGPPVEMTKQLLLPLLKEEVQHSRRERSLLDQLREKDWALGKIFDKIESTGLDLTTIFPGTAGLRAKKGISVSQAGKYVKGVAPFDEKIWSGQFGNGHARSCIATDIVDQISDSSGLSALDAIDTAPDRWWENLQVDGPSHKHLRSERFGTKNAESSKATLLNREDTNLGASSDEDEFQRQKTPPRLRGKKHQPEHGGQENNESDVKAEPIAQRSSPPISHHQQKQKPKGLGVIGGPKAVPKPSNERFSSSTESEKLPEPPVSADEETESDEGSSLQSPQRVVRSSQSAIPPQKHNLGRIGGGKVKPKERKPSSSPTSPVRTQSHSTNDEYPLTRQTQTKPVRKAGKLGVIGGSKQTTMPPARASPPRARTTFSGDEGDDLNLTSTRHGAEAEATRQSPPASKNPPPERERELTAQEKANKKREDLKRQLDEKSKAPTKKKRKF